MTWQITPFASIFFLSAALILAVVIIAFRHIDVRGARFFIFLVFSVEMWVLFTGLEYAVIEPAWNRPRYPHGFVVLLARKWRKRMGIEPTEDTATAPPKRF